jgi:hypothetical protein
MAITIDTGWMQPEVRAESASADATQSVRITTVLQSRRMFDRIKKNIEVQECPRALDSYWQREGMILDALHLFDPHVSAELTEIYNEHRAHLVHGGAPQSAQAVPHRTVSGNPPAHDGNMTKDETDDSFF